MDTTEPSETLSVQINRPVYNIDRLNNVFGFREEVVEDFPTKLKKLPNRINCSCDKIKSTIFGVFPILKWLPKYNFSECLTGDLIAGVTIAILQIPLGMGYATLSYLPPIYGIYMAFFPVIVYAFFGSSKHMQMGAFPVIMIMIGSVVETYRTDKGSNGVSLIGRNGSSITEDDVIMPVDVATALGIMAGIWQIIFGIFSIGYLSVFLSDALVSGFTTGAAVHVITSQIKNLLGIKLPNYVGMGKTVLIWISIFEEIHHTNVCALIVCLCCLALLIFNNEVIKAKFASKLPIPVPIELIVVVLSTLISYYVNLNEDYGLSIIGPVPTGFPVPKAPNFSLISHLLIQSFVICIVAFVISFSMCRIYAKRENYTVDPNQELIAHGLSNIVGSFFKCTIFCDAPARSLTSYAVGGKTLMASLVSCFILVFVLLFIGPLFRCLPYAALSSIIVAAMRGLVLQFKDIVYFWNRSRIDGVLWLVTLLAVVFLDIDYGLGISFLVSIIILLWETLRPYSSLVAPLPDTEIFMDTKFYQNVVKDDMIKSFRFYGPLHFANREYFRDHIYGQTHFYPTQWKAMIQKIEKIERKLKKLGNRNEVHSEMAQENPAFDTSDLDSAIVEDHHQYTVSVPVSPETPALDSTESNEKPSRRKPLLLPLQINNPANTLPLHTEEMDFGDTCNETQDTLEPLPHSFKQPVLVNQPNFRGGLPLGLPITTPPLHKVDVCPFDFQLTRVSVKKHKEVSESDAEVITIKRPRLPFKYLIVDFSGTCSIDPSGAEMVITIVNEFQSCNIQVYLCGIAGHVLRILQRVGIMGSVDKNQIFSCLEDAYRTACYAVAQNKATKL